MKAVTTPLVVRVIGSPCSTNSMYGRRANGRPYLTPRAIGWEHAVWGYTLAADPPCSCHRLTPPLQVDVTFYGVRGDADNYLKATLDGLKRALRIDDRHFTPVTAHVVRTTKSSKEPRGALITVTPAAQEITPHASSSSHTETGAESQAIEGAVPSR